MKAQIPWGVLSQCSIAVTIVVVLPACDAGPQYEDASFRSLDFEDVDPDEDGGPHPDAIIDVVRGGHPVGCEECGSHWTIVDSKYVVVHLVEELGDGVLHLAEKGDFFFQGKRRVVHTEDAFGDTDGYSADAHPLPDFMSEEAIPALAAPGKALLRIVHEGETIDINLAFVNNDTQVFDDPPVLE
ncbi:MAG: hypothetical protein KUG77_24630 [Nannocystaceae bacterium]|nr:hypothetical protein [Nannocystaceae bacterium]